MRKKRNGDTKKNMENTQQNGTQTKIDWQAEQKEAEESRGNKIKNDDILVFDMIKTANTIIKEYKNQKDGTITKSLKKAVTLLDGKELIIPMMLWAKIAANKNEYGDRIKGVKIKVTGAGIETRYEVFPQL